MPYELFQPPAAPVIDNDPSQRMISESPRESDDVEVHTNGSLTDETLDILLTGLHADQEALLSAWRESVRAGIPLGENLDRATALEKLAPGAVSYLQKECNMQYFGRYPLHILFDMYEHRNDKGPWGIMIYAKEDHNSALYDNRQLNEMATTLQGLFRIRIVECGSVSEVSHALSSSASRYGQAAFAVFSAHGSSEGISLGGFGESITKESLRENIGEILDQSLLPGAEICIAACSTGTTDSIGEVASVEGNRTTVAPDADSWLDSFGATVNFGRVCFNPRFGGATTKRLESQNPARRERLEQEKHLTVYAQWNLGQA